MFSPGSFLVTIIDMIIIKPLDCWIYDSFLRNVE